MSVSSAQLGSSGNPRASTMEARDRGTRDVAVRDIPGLNLEFHWTPYPVRRTRPGGFRVATSRSKLCTTKITVFFQVRPEVRHRPDADRAACLSLTLFESCRQENPSRKNSRTSKINSNQQEKKCLNTACSWSQPPTPSNIEWRSQVQRATRCHVVPTLPKSFITGFLEAVWNHLTHVGEASMR